MDIYRNGEIIGFSNYIFNAYDNIFEVLNKTEFEDMFDFKPDEFIKGRIIRILSEKIQIQPPLIIKQEPLHTFVKLAQSPKSEGGGGINKN